METTIFIVTVLLVGATWLLYALADALKPRP